MSKKYYIIPFFVPHKGCPHDCVFCNQNKISDTYNDLTEDIINEQVVQFIEKLGSLEKKHIEIAFFGGSFTGIDIKKQNEMLGAAKQWLNKGIIQDIRISTRPDYINKDILLNLKNHGVSIIELGVQSMDINVLNMSNRGHSPHDVQIASKLIKKFGFVLGLQMMIGLPGDTHEKDIYTAHKLVSYSPAFVRIYPALVIKGTALESMYSIGTYRPLTLEDGIRTVKELYKIFYFNNIEIIRIGLQPTENIMLGQDVVAGPFHPAFRQLVEAAIFKEKLDKLLSIYNNRIQSLIFEVNSKDVCKLVGNKKSNISYLKNKYGFMNYKIIKNNSIDTSKVSILINNTDKIMASIL